MGETTVLYVLTTLAQSCAALAAFVGAVGVFRMQMLREQRREAEREFRSSVPRFTREIPAFESPIAVVVDALDKEERRQTPVPPTVAKAREAHVHWEAFVPRLRWSRAALLILEMWNLAIIAASLIGFNYVSALALSSCFSRVLWAVAVVTALVPLWCIWVWTRGVEK